MNPLTELRHLVVPEVCPVCRSDVPSGADGLCRTCTNDLRTFDSPRCTACGATVDGALDVCSECLRRPERPWTHAVSVFPFHSRETRDIIHRFKYGGQPWLASFLGYYMAENWLEHGQGRPAVLVPVPLHPWKYWRRGYNQAGLLARDVARRLSVPVCDLLRRTHWSKPQANLGYDQRRRNTKRIFSCKRNAQLEQRHIVVVDDVLTTGSTLEAAVGVLKQRYPTAQTMVLTVARG